MMASYPRPSIPFLYSYYFHLARVMATVAQNNGAILWAHMGLFSQFNFFIHDKKIKLGLVCPENQYLPMP